MSRTTRQTLFRAAAGLVQQVIDTAPADAPADLARLVALRGKPGYALALNRYVARTDVVAGLGYALLGEWATFADAPKEAWLGYFIWRAG